MVLATCMTRRRAKWSDDDIENSNRGIVVVLIAFAPERL